MREFHAHTHVGTGTSPCSASEYACPLATRMQGREPNVGSIKEKGRRRATGAIHVADAPAKLRRGRNTPNDRGETNHDGFP
jgi:hypothetical protein